VRRDLKTLGGKVYDVAVIGGGIYGISVARDASLRGLSVALVEQGDFGHATSSNHHKIIHGGFRYLQHGDLKRMREAIRERSALLRIAPHLVRPLPIMIPTFGEFLQSKTLFSAALKLNDLIGIDRNRYLRRETRIPAGRVVSRAECLRLCPELDQPRMTGGALFFDGQVHNPDRLNLALLMSAVKAGAEAANYVAAGDFCFDGNAVAGIKARDLLGGESFAVCARVVVNCAGPWADQLLARLTAPVKRQAPGLLKSVVLVTRPLLGGDIGIGVPSRFEYKDSDAVVDKGFRYLFITPWRGTSLVGTFQSAYAQEPQALGVGQEDFSGAIREVNAALPAARLKASDVLWVLRGLVPGFENGGAQLQKHHEIRDHGAADGIEGLISVFGVKYTTARSVAEKTVDLVFAKLKRRSPDCRTDQQPVHGGAIEDLDELRARALAAKPALLGAESLRHLVDNHGSAGEELLRLCEADSRWAEPVAGDTPVIKAEVVHGVRAEMAQKLSDVVFRRTDLATAGYPGDGAVFSCAEIMAGELGWGRARLEQEIEDVQCEFGRRGVRQCRSAAGSAF
jgi:glycerol-3-phosphate dehydrogenase